MRWRIVIVLAVLASLGVMVPVVWGIWTATRTAGGAVTATTVAAPNLYLCEPDAGGCGQDDSGADEVIFEGLENLLPNTFAFDSLRLRNVGSQSLDIVRAVTTISEASDPGGDCSFLPTVRIGLAALGLIGPIPPEIADDHPLDFAQSQGLQSFARAVDDPRYGSFPGSSLAVHIAAGEHEDFRIQVLMPGNAPGGCEDNGWNISISWEVVTDITR